MNILIVTSQQFACTGNAGLHFIGYKKYIVGTAQVVTFFQISLIGYISTCLSLNGLNQESGHMRMFVQHFRQCFGIIVGNHDKTGGKRSVVIVSVRINGERNDSGSTPMKIIPAYNDFRRILGKLFYFIRPFAAKLQCGFYRLGSRIHR